MIHDELSNDAYKPVVSKPSLQQYDNYQIYDIHCIDIAYAVSNGAIIQPELQKSFIAVQAYNPTPILCDFNQIIATYK
jgi:hypothetical protein